MNRTLLAILALCLFSVSARAEEFTRVPALEPNVAFWKKVYIEWSLNQIAFHDEKDLGAIYRVIRVPARGEKNAAGLTRQEAIRKGQAETEAALRSLAKKQPKTNAGLSGVEKEVFDNLAHIKAADKYTRGTLRAQNGLRERFIQGWNNSGLYQQFISAELKRNGLPEELIAVAFVESLFYVGAKSKVGAAGVWQFMSYTGREYMQLNNVVDERWDPILATEAAAKYLKQARKELGAWPLAITSYNYGRAGMRNLAENAGSKDFGVILAVSKNKRFGFAARNYYASFLAVNDILKNKDVLLKGMPRKASWSYDIIRTPFPMYATTLYATGELDAATFESLNPALTNEARDGKIPLPHGMSIRLPKGKAASISAKLAALPERDKLKAMRAVKAIHKASGKETVKEIAKKYSLGGDTLAAATGLNIDDVPQKGQQVPIPHTQARYTLLPEARGMPLPALPVSQPILVADASSLVSEPDEPDTDKPEKLEKGTLVAKKPPAETPSKSGIVTVSAIVATEIGDSLPAVDVIAGVGGGPVPDVDVIAGDHGLGDAWSEPMVAEVPQS